MQSGVAPLRKAIWQLLRKLNTLLLQNLCPHKNLHMDVYRSLVHNCQNLEANIHCGMSRQQDIIQWLKRIFKTWKDTEEPWMDIPRRKDSIGMLPIVWHFEKGKTRETVKKKKSVIGRVYFRGRRKWQPTPVSLTGESQGQGSLVGCHLWGRTESDTTDVA